LCMRPKILVWHSTMWRHARNMLDFNYLFTSKMETFGGLAVYVLCAKCVEFVRLYP
jgi:hypothetical protein